MGIRSAHTTWYKCGTKQRTFYCNVHYTDLPGWPGVWWTWFRQPISETLTVQHPPHSSIQRILLALIKLSHILVIVNYWLAETPINLRSFSSNQHNCDVVYWREGAVNVLTTKRSDSCFMRPSALYKSFSSSSSSSSSSTAAEKVNKMRYDILDCRLSR